MPKVLLLILSLLPALPAQAEPAPWYWWASRVDGARVCRQTSPGEGWRRERGPYPSARCGAGLAR